MSPTSANASSARSASTASAGNNSILTRLGRSGSRPARSAMHHRPMKSNRVSKASSASCSFWKKPGLIERALTPQPARARPAYGGSVRRRVRWPWRSGGATGPRRPISESPRAAVRGRAAGNAAAHALDVASGELLGAGAAARACASCFDRCSRTAAAGRMRTRVATAGGTGRSMARSGSLRHVLVEVPSQEQRRIDEHRRAPFDYGPTREEPVGLAVHQDMPQGIFGAEKALVLALKVLHALEALEACQKLLLSHSSNSVVE